jgi:N-acetylmuramoyl-L-alanine amidase
MITLAWYLLKVIICSGILCGYYFIALRNKAFHRWNRFYLLATIAISLTIPLMKINFFANAGDNGTVVTVLQTISYGDEVVVENSGHNSFQLDAENVVEAGYLLVSVIFLFIFFASLYKINRLRKRYPETKIEDISFVNTDAKGTPFSFFKFIFWNKAIDIYSSSGQQIFNHEIAHVKEKHSYDKVFMNVVLIFFWINPFFWLIRKELYMIHEFIADKEALEDSNVNAFAEMILHTVYPGQNFSLTNNFFYSPIKRRLLMLTKNKNSKVSYISRLLVLPLAAMVFFAFTLKVKNRSGNLYNGKTITVVIDAGHGGDDNGAHSPGGIKEKDITLSIAKKVAELNSNPHIEILLSRKDDVPLSVKDRVEFAKSNNANIFISLHINAAANEQLNGFSVLVDKNYSDQNVLLGSALISELKKSYQTEDKVGVRDKGVWVLDHNICPAALLQCGYLSNPGDLGFITNSVDQEKIAQNILNAINEYAAAKEKFIGESSAIAFDSMPHPQHGSIPKNTLYVINGKISTSQQAKEVDRENIESINVVKGDSAIKKYGEKGKNGVIEITKKSIDVKKIKGVKNDTIPDKIFTKVENEASFPGGLQGWIKYISKAISDSIDKFTEADYGTCVVRFIVNTDGTVSDVVATTMKETELAKVSISAIRNGPKWIPASQNGHTVAAYRLQPITLTNPEKKPGSTEDEKNQNSSASNKSENSQEAIFTKLEKNATFPGGNSEWLKYITRVIQKNATELTADKNSHGTCKVRFIVNKDGKISYVQAITKQDSKLADVAVNAIENGPHWIPGMQNGRVANSYVIQQVTFFLNDTKGNIQMEPK